MVYGEQMQTFSLMDNTNVPEGADDKHTEEGLDVELALDDRSRAV